ncbi:MAG TPA: hypothetical protein VFG09_06085 [Thermodesulfovibrionales bacterium]|nr:hypothetical protein [Thermodesulfovibrionales bacterium]
MTDLNAGLIDFFSSNYKPGLIALIGSNDPIGMAIREAQALVTKDHQPSLWSHCFLLGDLRLDRRGPGNTITKSPYIFESDLKVKLFKPQVRNGAQENWIGKWCGTNVEHAALIDFGLSGNERDAVLATALQLVDEQVLYPIQELLGTWWAIITGKQWLPNPLNDPHAMYCSAFVRYCYKEAGRDFLGSDIDVSNTTPEDIARAGAQAINIFGSD